ncbi:MAG: trypsin-like peptidase domain-containing protein [Hydrogenophaga sp.]|nr:trypsin-like peptidase domain-containing protein [Hydrogenophaga sp.]
MPAPLRARVVALLMLLVHALAAPASAGLADTVARVKPSVVIVGTFRATDSPRFQLRGTGFLVGDGQRVVTNAHVLPDGPASPGEPALVVQVRTGAGEWQVRAATLVGRDDARDLALLHMAGATGPALRLGDSARVREGDSLAFTGFPIGGVLGFAPVTHRALVSSITAAALPSPSAHRLKEQAIRSLRQGSFNIFQLDATAYPGNSGGPLFHPDTGEVVGVMNMVLIKGTRESALSQPSGLSYAIPVRHVHELLKRHP